MFKSTVKLYDLGKINLTSLCFDFHREKKMNMHPISSLRIANRIIDKAFRQSVGGPPLSRIYMQRTPRYQMLTLLTISPSLSDAQLPFPPAQHCEK